MTEFVEKHPQSKNRSRAYYRSFSGWKKRPEKLNRKNLAIIAWLQDKESKEVYQAVYRDI